MKSRISCLLLLLSILFSGCSKYGYVSLNFPTDPQVFLPDNVDEIAVVNRSQTSEEDQSRKILEAVATSEIAGSDRIASDECIKGIFDASQNWEGTVVVIPEMLKLYGTGTREMPELLDWDKVAAICRGERADALLVLETFDSNTDLLLAAAGQQVVSLIARGKPAASVPDQVNMNVSCYWRLYEPSTRTVIDQFQHNSYMKFNLVNGIPPPGALKEVAYAAGQTYVSRFLPGYYTLKRRLYKRTSGSAKHPFKAGFRRTEVGNWEGGIEIWEELSGHPKHKTAGRACLNVAVGNEVLGNTDEAIKWAQQSYEYYGDKLGRDYAKILLRRKALEGE